MQRAVSYINLKIQMRLGALGHEFGGRAFLSSVWVNLHGLLLSSQGRLKQEANSNPLNFFSLQEVFDDPSNHS